MNHPRTSQHIFAESGPDPKFADSQSGGNTGWNIVLSQHTFPLNHHTFLLSQDHSIKRLGFNL